MTTKMLSRDEEISLIRAWRESRDTIARDRLFSAYRPLVISMARKRKRKQQLADAIQAGWEGLAKAIADFDESHGCGLATIAKISVAQALTRANLAESVVPTPPSFAAKRYQAHYGRLRDQWEARTGRELDGDGMAWVAEQLEVGADTLAALVAAHAGHAPIAHEDGESDIADDAAVGEDKIAERLDMARARAALQDEKLLSKKERDVISMRKAGLTLKEIGARMGFSHERARQYELSAIAKVRASLGLAA